MTKEPKKLAELFYDTLKDIYLAEKKNLCDIAKNGEGSSEQGA